MKSIEEIARECGLILPKTNLSLCASFLDKLQAFAEAYHKQKMEELEPVCYLKAYSYQNGLDYDEGFEVCGEYSANSFPVYTLPSKG